MTVYGHPITYGTIGTVVAGILAAFASKILLQEIIDFRKHKILVIILQIH